MDPLPNFIAFHWRRLQISPGGRSTHIVHSIYNTKPQEQAVLLPCPFCNIYKDFIYAIFPDKPGQHSPLTYAFLNALCHNIQIFLQAASHNVCILRGGDNFATFKEIERPKDNCILVQEVRISLARISLVSLFGPMCH